MITRKTVYILVAFVLTAFSLQAQQFKALIKQLDTHKGIQKVNTLLKLGDYYIYKDGTVKTDLDSAYTFTQQAETESNHIKYDYGASRSLALYARIYGERQDKAKSTAYANKAMQLALPRKYYDVCGEAYQELYARCDYYKEMTKKMGYLDKAIRSFRQKSTGLQLADILTIAAEDYNYMGESEKPMVLINEALSVYKGIGHKDMMNVYRVAGSLYAGRGDYKKSIQYLLQAIDAAEGKEHVDELISYIYNQLSANYYHLQDRKLSDKYLKLSLDYALKAGNTEMVYTAANNIVYNLLSHSKYKEAENFLKDIYRRHKPESIADVFTVKDCFLSIYTKLMQYNKAEQYCNEIIALSNSEKGEDVPPQILFNANLSVSRFYLAKGDYAAARKYLDSNLNNIDTRGYSAKKRVYTLAYQVDSAQGNLARAIEYLKKVKTVDDSIFNIEKNKEISQLQISYETEQKDKDIQLKANNIALLNKEKELQQQKIEQTDIERNIAIGGGIIVFIAALSILYAYRNKLKLTNLLQKQKVEITNKNDKLNKLVDEKEWLLKEIHHRVKNNLQVVMSLLNTQSAYLTDKAAQVAITDSQRRVHSIALIHQQLYKSDDVSSISIYRYISELVSYLKDTYSSAFVKFKIDVDDIELNIVHTMPIGLILNEAITNCFKYAFEPGQKGSIKISLRELGEGNYELIVHDNGKGLPEGFSIDNCNSLGMDLLRGLSGDLNGEFKIYNEDGTVIQIVFNIQPHS